MDTETKRSRTITWADPFAIPKATAGKSGLEALREVFEGRLPPPPIAETMGFTGVHVEEGKAVFEGEPGEHLYNPIGVGHGGVALSPGDSAMGRADPPPLALGSPYTTLPITTYISPPNRAPTG